MVTSNICHMSWTCWVELTIPIYLVEHAASCKQQDIIIQNLNLRKEVGIAIKSKKTNSQLEPVRNTL